MNEPVMRSLPLDDYPGRFLSVTAADIVSQRALGWPDFHPEDFCHRCGVANVSWYTDSATWNDVMEDETRWNGIICVPCFIALTEDRVGGCAWRLTRDKYGSEVLALLHAGSLPVTTTLVSTHAYPCDRGIPNNVTGRGQHHFEASPNGVVVCRYCGRKP